MISCTKSVCQHFQAASGPMIPLNICAKYHYRDSKITSSYKYECITTDMVGTYPVLKYYPNSDSCNGEYNMTPQFDTHYHDCNGDICDYTKIRYYRLNDEDKQNNVDVCKDNTNIKDKMGYVEFPFVTHCWKVYSHQTNKYESRKLNCSQDTANLTYFTGEHCEMNTTQKKIELKGCDSESYYLTKNISHLPFWNGTIYEGNYTLYVEVKECGTVSNNKKDNMWIYITIIGGGCIVLIICCIGLLLLRHKRKHVPSNNIQDDRLLLDNDSGDIQNKQ